MKARSTWRPRSGLFRTTWLRAALLVLLSAVVLFGALTACGSGGALTGEASRAAADDSALHDQIAAGRGGAEVTFHATVVTEPVQVGSHEHLNVRTPAGDTLEVDHNTSLASAVPAHAGDRLVVHGQLYVDPGRSGIHCTHHRTSRGCPQPGWIELAGSYFE